MKWMFIGSLTHAKTTSNNFSIAGDITQKSIIEGFSQSLQPPQSVISMFPQKAFPSSGLFHHSYINDGISNLFYVNLPLIKQISFAFAASWQIILNIRKFDSIVLYNIGLYNALPILIGSLLKKKIIAIVHDVVIPGKNVGNPLLAYLDLLCLKSLRSKLYIVFPISEYIKIDFFKHVRSLVIEGGLPQETLDFFEHNEEYRAKGEKNVVFAGGLNFQNGIEEILEAISLIEDESISFNFFGRGPLAKNIENAAAIDSRIQFFGLVNHSQLLKYIKKEASILLNIRTEKTASTKYFFPSKLLEYLSSGIPVISSRFSTLPDEYNKFLNLTTENPREIAKILNDVLQNYEVCNIKAKEGRIWTHQEKSWQYQCSRMVKEILK